MASRSGTAPQPGEWITPPRRGHRARGAVICPPARGSRRQALGLAASVGLARALRCARRVRVAVFFTGDELAMPGEPLQPGAIYNSNRFTLRGCWRNSAAHDTDYGIVPDTLEATRATLRAAAAGARPDHHLGGVSVGEEDHIKPAVEAEGRLNMWQIADQAGQAARVRRGAPRRRAMAAASSSACRAIRCRALSLSCCSCGLSCCVCRACRRATPTASYRDARRLRRGPRPTAATNSCARGINDAGGLDLFPNQGSGVLTSTVWGDGLIDNPPGQAIARGDTVRFIPFAFLQH